MVEAEPVGFPSAPVSKRRLFLDARNMGVVQAITFDRKGDMWKGLEGGGGQRRTEHGEMLVADGRPEWSWCWAISHDVQRNDVTRFHHGQTCRGNWDSALDPDIDLVTEYMTQQALRRIGF